MGGGEWIQIVRKAKEKGRLDIGLAGILEQARCC